MPLTFPPSVLARPNQCDGQILVTEDMLGLSERAPSFVKEFANIDRQIEAALQAYAWEVKARVFPGPNHVYGMKSVEKLRVS